MSASSVELQSAPLARYCLADDAAMIEKYGRLLQSDPENAAVLKMLGQIACEQKQFAIALDYLGRAARLIEDDPDLYFYLALALNSLGKPGEALGYYEQAVQLDPGHADAHNQRGLILFQSGRADEAAQCFVLALQARPDLVAAHNNLGLMLQAQGKLDAARVHYLSVLALQPGHIAALVNLGSIHLAQGEPMEACRLCRQALQLAPACVAAHMQLGIASLILGKVAAAQASFIEACRIEPVHAKAYLYYVNSKKIETAELGVVQMLEDLLACGKLDAEAQSDSHFALGKCYDDLGSFALAFSHYRQGNRLERGKRVFDREQQALEFSRIRQTYDEEFFRRRVAFGNCSDLPVFVVGMPRSGSSLVEHIIASHSGAFGAGELEFWNEKKMLHALAPQFDSAAVDELAQEYLSHLRKFSTNAACIVDKMPQNFMHLGLIHLAFPQARIIHCRRNPLDTCLSAYFQKFSFAHDYACSRSDLAFYYQQYEQLMQHWKRVLPVPILEVNYEDLVCNQEQVSRGILDFCSLEWEEKCLDFNQTERMVYTASNWQVRQPLYDTSIGRWKNYREFLGPLAELGGANTRSRARS